MHNRQLKTPVKKIPEVIRETVVQKKIKLKPANDKVSIQSKPNSSSQ
jgi:hypothetical protein